MFEGVELVVVDYETKSSVGASFETFRHDFSVFSLSCAWYVGKEIKTFFTAAPMNIRMTLSELARRNIKIVAHNLPYEMSVTSVCYPDINLNWYVDTMRLCQTRDAGGDEFAIPELSLEQTIAKELGELDEKKLKKAFSKTRGLSLEACSARFLPEDRHNHKSEAHNYLQEHFKIKTNHGRHLDKLPYDVLERYNNGDVINTLLLYIDCIEFFKTIKYDWQPDHRLYFDRARLITKAYNQGIAIDRVKLYNYILELEDEIDKIELDFHTAFADELERVKVFRRRKFLGEFLLFANLKTRRGFIKRFQAITSGKHKENWESFNIGSSHHLRILCCDVLGMTPKFLTKLGSPSFKSSHLSQWGQYGDILLLRRKRLLVLQQCVNTYLASEFDGRAHPSIRVAGTRTNRVSGGVNT